MNDLFEIARYTLPSLMVLLAVWIVLRYFMRKMTDDRKFDTLLQNSKKSLPLQLQAYERLALFLERITVDSLLAREQDSNLTSREFHQHLLGSIRVEFEHNLSQQIYMSQEAWNVVRNAREGVVRMVNMAAMDVDPDGRAVELSKKIIEIQMEASNSPTHVALEFLRKEAHTLMGR